MLKKIAQLLMMFMAFTAVLHAQVTTGTLVGTIKDGKNQSLDGATVTAVHEPSGSRYVTIAKEKGLFTLPGLRVGGPYTVEITYAGYDKQVFNDIYVALGAPLKIDVVLLNKSETLSDVTVTARSKNGLIGAQRKGTATNISARQIAELPSVSRSIQDFTRLTPQAYSIKNGTDGSNLGVTFGGQNNRYNQFSIDGANATDVFGLAGSGTNGGQANANPISIEAIQDVQVSLSPYDITEGGFTGGGINAVTKSGTNTIHGAAYAFYQNQGLVGKNGYNNQKYADFKATTFGASLGGAIVKNKLFYYANFEKFDKSSPVPFNPSDPNSGTKFDKTTVANLYDYISKTYGYDAGSYDNIDKKQSSTNLFARIDWNINDHNKLTVRHSYVDASNDVISRGPTSISFGNNAYQFLSTTNSSVAELNSTFGSSASNVLRVTYNRVRDSRSPKGSPFPALTIYDAGLTYNIGSEFSSQVNALNQDNFTITDNFTLYRGKHTLTFGTNNEFYNTKNYFLQGYYGSYTYGQNSASATGIAAFMANSAPPNSYTVTYSTKGADDKAPATLHAAQFSVYGQDAWAVTDRFNLTYGLRVDVPVFFNKPDANDAFNSDPAFAIYGVQNNKVPKSTPLFSPRAGFNWDINGNAKTQLRGGAGLFTGRVPFVWVSNQYSGTGIASIRYTQRPADLRFNYDPTDSHLGAYIPPSNTPPATEVDFTDKNFKFPQVFRANLALEQKLPIWGLIGSIEAVYTKTLNNINFKNINLTQFPDSTIKFGSTSRPFWTSRVTNNFTDVIMLTNTNQGYAYNFTVQLQKPYSKGWTGSIAYTYGRSTGLNDGTSSVALSNWRYAYNVNGLNNLDLSRNNYDLGSKVIGYISKTFKYGKGRFATTIGLVYTGVSGQPFSYLFGGNVNGDDISNKSNSAGLFYVPANKAQANLADFTRKNADGTSTVVTADQQWSDLQTFILSNDYLAKNIGKNTARNGARMPWESHFDLKLVQDIGLVKSHKLQITFDIMNIGNMIDKKAGWSYFVTNQSINVLSAVTNGANNTKYNFDITKMNLIDGVYRPYYVTDFGSRWSGQLGLRYSF